VERLAEGRTAEVFAYGDGRVLKLDRPDWCGLAPFEGALLGGLAAAGLPVARAHGSVTVDGRSGVVLDRVEGPTLLRVLEDSGPDEELRDRLAARFVSLQHEINAATVPGLPDLVPRLRTELESTVEDAALRAELVALLAALDDGRRGVCHFDFHPGNVLVAPDGRWVVIDWLTVAAGPPAADVARTLVLWSLAPRPAVRAFLRAVRRESVSRRGFDDATLDAWVRVVAASRVGEGFGAVESAWLRRVAGGSERLFT
jgi:aminoglycoside phosphotransferase (APT) family kinase protein